MSSTGPGYDPVPDSQLIAGMGNLTKTVAEHTAQLGQTVNELRKLQTSDKQTRNIIKWIRGLLGFDIVGTVAGIIAGIVFGASVQTLATANEKAIKQISVATHEQCNLLDLFINLKNPNARAVFAQGPQAYDLDYQRIESSYHNLDCAHRL